MTGDTLIAWLTTHAVALVVGLIVLVLIYRFAKPVIHRFVLAILRAQQATLDGGGEPAEEVRKRATTLEELLQKLIRLAVFALFIVLILSVFDLWEMLAGLALIAAGLTIAGQSIILDYLMGTLILFEGQYYKGDWLVVDWGNVPIEGEVEEVGLRRTVLRDTNGTVHSVSNGVIRVASNMTRIYGVATVEILVLRAHDIDKAFAVINKVCDEMAADEAWKDKLLQDTPRVLVVSQLTIDGVMVRIRIRTKAPDRWTAASELRRRLAIAFDESEIPIGRWDALPAGTLEMSTVIGKKGSPPQ
jgi:moderate conductance mechanosensitive channel